MMRIAIIGYGKMGRAVAEAAKARSIEIAAIVDPAAPDATYKYVTREALSGADVAVDFTAPGAALANIKAVAALGKDIVVGTTGWYGSLDEARASVKQYGTGMVYSPNFSIGVSLFFRIVRDASRLMNSFPGYDPYVIEMHHRQKTDAPGGTARRLGEIVIGAVARKKRLAFDRIDGRKIDPDELHVASVRAGYYPGIHTVGFDGEADTIELVHTARSRAGFADGALAAAAWVSGRKGVYTLDDMISEMAGGDQ